MNINGIVQIVLLIVLVVVLVRFVRNVMVEPYHTGQQHAPVSRFSSIQMAPLNDPGLYGQMF